MAKGDDFQFRVRPPPEPAAQQRTDRRHGAVESRENRDWRDCADRLDKSEIRRISFSGRARSNRVYRKPYTLRGIRRGRNSPNTMK
jgi:hypothetical protein